MGGSAARAPVAMTARLEAQRLVRRPRRCRARLKRASPRKTSTPSFSSGSAAAESLALMRARRRRMRSITAAKSTVGVAAARTPKLAASATSRDDARGADDALRRHAADVQAVAAHQVAFDQRDPRAQPGGAGGGHQAGGAGADHDQVVAPAGVGFVQSGGCTLATRAWLYSSCGRHARCCMRLLATAGPSSHSERSPAAGRSILAHWDAGLTRRFRPFRPPQARASRDSSGGKPPPPAPLP